MMTAAFILGTAMFAGPAFARRWADRNEFLAVALMAAGALVLGTALIWTFTAPLPSKADRISLSPATRIDRAHDALVSVHLP